MKVAIEVTASDIEVGKPKHFCLCPIAIAAKRALKSENPVSVFATALRIDGRIGYIPLPRVAQDFVQKFDSGDCVTPISFAVEIDEPSAEIQKYQGD